jgi:hypothetical protein
MDNILLFSNEIKKSALVDELDPTIFDCITALQERLSDRHPFKLEKDENEIADEILRYLIAIKNKDRVCLPPPIDFSKPMFTARWITSKLKRNRSAR